MEVRSLCQTQIGPRGREQGVNSKLMGKENNFSFQNGWGFLFLVFGRQMGHYYFNALIFYFL